MSCICITFYLQMHPLQRLLLFPSQKSICGFAFRFIDGVRPKVGIGQADWFAKNYIPLQYTWRNGINFYDMDEYLCSCAFYININFNLKVVWIWPSGSTALQIYGEKSRIKDTVSSRIIRKKQQHKSYKDIRVRHMWSLQLVIYTAFYIIF